MTENKKIVNNPFKDSQMASGWEGLKGSSSINEYD